VTTEPLSTTEARAHLRVTEDDPYIADLPAYVVAARVHAEQYLNASIVVQERTLVLDRFPPWAINLPDGPVLSVTSIAYIDTDGASQTVAAHWRSLDTITPANFDDWPATQDRIGAVTITYQAGLMSGSPLTLPDKYADIKSAIKLILSDLWDNRSAGIIGAGFSVNPTVERLLHFHRRNLGV
jgi:uncharacterized phiE125 gp8 family phage protein